MASLPLDANVLFLTVMATKMPFVGRDDSLAAQRPGRLAKPQANLAAVRDIHERGRGGGPTS